MRNLLHVSAGFALVLSLSPAAFAGFVNGVERFEGTQMDLQTWEVFHDPISETPGTITQDDSIVIDGSLTTYTTRERLIGVGEGVRVDVTHLRLNGGSIHLRNDQNPSGGIWMGLDRSDPFEVIGFRPTGPDTASGAPLVRPGGDSDDFLTQALGETLTYEIIRLSATTARWSAYDASGGLLGTRTASIGDPITEDLSISLQAIQGAARFDNVTLVPIPLPPAVVPGLAVLAGAIGATVLRRRGPSATRTRRTAQ